MPSRLPVVLCIASNPAGVLAGEQPAVFDGTTVWPQARVLLNFLRSAAPCNVLQL